MTGSTPNQEIINKVAKSLHSLVSKSKNKNKGLDWTLAKEKDYLEGVNLEVAESSEIREGSEKQEASLDLVAEKSHICVWFWTQFRSLDFSTLPLILSVSKYSRYISLSKVKSSYFHLPITTLA